MDPLGEQLRALTALAGDALLACDVDGRCVHFNAAAERVFGLDQDRALGRRLEQLLQDRSPPGSLAAVRDLVAALARGQEAVGEVVVVDDDRGSRHLSYVLRPIRIDGRLIGSALRIQDHGEAQAQARAERDARLWLERIADSLPHLIWTATGQERIAYCSRRVERYAGIHRRADGSWSWQGIVHPDDLARTLQAWQQAQALDATYQCEHRLQMADGSYRWHLSRAEPIADAEGLRTWYGSATDIHDLRLAEQALRQNEQRFRALADNIAQLAWMADASGWIFWYNERWYAYTGTTLQEMQGWGWRSVHHPDHVERVVARIQRSWDTGEPWEDTFPLRGADGSYRWFLSRALPIRDARGEIVLWFGTNTDVTDQLEVEAALRAANAELEQFVFVAAHDLQEPLRSIALSADLASMQVGENQACLPHVNRIRTGVLRMRRLIEDLLTYSRIVHHDREGDGERVAVEAALADARAQLRDRIAESGAEISHDPLPQVACDPGQLSLVFQNLLGNAIKYQAPGTQPRIHVSAERQEGEWILCVRDNGIGFDPRYSERIFGLFKRLHSDRYGGTGLGLAICRRIVERYGGRIWAESAGEGSGGASFYFSLPAIEAAEAA